MANQNKLKAWVRYDGTGRVVTGGPIFQANKPKVGNWRQMNASLCCNGSTPSHSTTTTTTQGGGGVTPTAYAIIDSSSLEFVCAGVPGWLVYAAQSTLGAGVTLYYDAALTQPWEGQQYISHEGIIYTLSGATIIDNGTPCGSITTTSTTTASLQSYRISSTGCQGCPNGCSQDLNAGSFVYAAGPAYSYPRQLFTDPSLTVPFTGSNGNYAMMQGYPSGTAYSVFVQDGQMLYESTPCF